jgi:3-phenylpropionate/trans-cinnamate dioxygenase ferredoxin component
MAERVAGRDDIPVGEMRSFEVGGREVAVANADGTFYAFEDECTHQFCRLSEGDIEGDRVICACHGSEFDLETGDAVNPPATEPVETYSISVEGDDLLVDLG